MHPYSHILSPIQVGNLLLPTRLTSSAGAHYSQELPNRALNGASVIYISHIMLKTSLLASVANPNGVDGPGGPRMSDKDRPFRRSNSVTSRLFSSFAMALLRAG